MLDRIANEIVADKFVAETAVRNLSYGRVERLGSVE